MRHILLIAMLLLGGCATLPHDELRQAVQAGRPEAALAALSEEAVSSRDRLLALMERGLILHDMGRYEASARAFIRAEKQLDEWDYVSVSEQARTLVVNDWAGSYKGEYSERLWIHSYQMMNYLLLGDFEKAAVEARMALKVLERWEKPLEQALFTRALIALSFESAGKFNDAFIEYRKLAERLPSEKLIARELYWSALRSGLTSQAEKYRPMLGTRSQRTDPEKLAEVIVFVAHGIIPRKEATDVLVAPDIRLSFPTYPPVAVHKPRYRIVADGEPTPFEEITTLLPDVARASLDARGKALLAKQTARASAKYNLAHRLKKENEVAGELLKLAFFILEEADTRGWSTLPETLSLLRIPLPPGRHDIRIETGGRPLLVLDGIELGAGQRIYRKIRVTIQLTPEMRHLGVGKWSFALANSRQLLPALPYLGHPWPRHFPP